MQENASYEVDNYVVGAKAIGSFGVLGNAEMISRNLQQKIDFNLICCHLLVGLP